MNLSLARGVANLKVPYSLTPFNQQGSARVCSSRAFPANSRTPVWSFFTVHRGCPLGGGEGGLTMTLLSTTINQHDWLVLQRGIRIHQYLDDWLVRATSHQICLQHTLTLVALCRELGWLVNKEKSELDPKQVFNFVGYQFDLGEGKVRPTPERWQTLTDKILSILSGPVCPVRKFMSLIGLLTATEKQVHLGRLHNEAHTVAQLEGTRVTGKGDTRSQVPPPSLKMVAGGKQCSSGQPLHPLNMLCKSLQTHPGWGAHLNERTARGTWSVPESKLHINHLELKAVFLALKEFQELCSNNIVLVATDNSGCLYQQRRGGEVWLPVCLTVENTVLVHQEAGNPSRHVTSPAG